MPVPPDIREQRDIASAISTVEEKIGLHRRRQESLKDVFRTLLHQLITAELRVDDINVPSLDGAIAA
jgi:type I restriction enzyme S subunit